MSVPSPVVQFDASRESGRFELACLPQVAHVNT